MIAFLAFTGILLAFGIDSSLPAFDELRDAFGLEIADRFDFDGFSLIYLRNPESDFELELTVNRGTAEAYDLGNGYGHMAFVVDDLQAEHQRIVGLGYEAADIKELQHGGQLLARYFFMTDPDGYKIELLQRHGRYR